MTRSARTNPVLSDLQIASSLLDDIYIPLDSGKDVDNSSLTTLRAE